MSDITASLAAVDLIEYKFMYLEKLSIITRIYLSSSIDGGNGPMVSTLNSSIGANECNTNGVICILAALSLFFYKNCIV